MIDVETSRAPAIVSRVVSTAHRNGVVVVGSYHDFEGTPEEEEL